MARGYWWFRYAGWLRWPVVIYPLKQLLLMVYLIYKCYYVLFSMSSKKESSPWIFSMMVLSISCCFLFFSLLDLIGIMDVLNEYIMKGDPLAKRGKILVLACIPSYAICWFIIHYIVFKLAKASKTDGLSERYSFNVTKGDKVVCWLVLALPFFTLAIHGYLKNPAG